MKVRKNADIILLVIFIAIIFILSSLGGDTSKTQSNSLSLIIIRLIGYLGGRVNYNLREVDLVIRKLAHFVEYLTLTSIFAIVVYKRVKSWLLGFILIGLTMFMIPLIDEFILQSISSGRTPQIIDVALDYSAILLSLCIMTFSFISFRGTHKRDL